VDGLLAGYLRRERELLLFLPEAEPRRSRVAREVARALVHLAASRDEAHRGMLLTEIDGEVATGHPAARFLIEAGFSATAMGLQARVSGTRVAMSSRGGPSMAEQPRQGDDLIDTQGPETSADEQERVRSSEDSDRSPEQAGEDAPRGRGKEGVEDTDPDSVHSTINRDDTVSD
jgi:hypothetical protein